MSPRARRPGKHYTPEEARARIPVVAQRLALQAVDLVIALERHPLDSHEIEHRIWALSGQAGYLSRLCHLVWKHEGLKRAVAQGAA